MTGSTYETSNFGSKRKSKYTLMSTPTVFTSKPKDFNEFLASPFSRAPQRQHEGKSAKSCLESRRQSNRLINNSPMRPLPKFPPKSYLSPVIKYNTNKTRSSLAKFANAALHRREGSSSVGMSCKILDDEQSFQYNSR